MKAEDLKNEIIYPQEYEQASNSYLMAVVSLIGGLPLPIINLFAAVGYYLGQRKSSYFVRRHCIQSLLGQAILVPFNSFGFAWTLKIFIHSLSKHEYTSNESDVLFNSISPLYWMYIAFLILLNIMDFIAVIYTAARVRKGDDVRWPVIGSIAAALTSGQKRDPFKI